MWLFNLIVVFLSVANLILFLMMLDVLKQVKEENK